MYNNTTPVYIDTEINILNKNIKKGKIIPSSLTLSTTGQSLPFFLQQPFIYSKRNTRRNLLNNGNKKKYKRGKIVVDFYGYI